MRIKKRYILLSLMLFLVLGVYFANKTIAHTTKDLHTSDLKQVDHHRVGLVLGTSKLLKSGNINPYYSYRLNATWKLYQANKIDFVLVSGDNGNKNYDEPSAFKEDLIKLGIPSDKIYLDYAGFRTLDSVVRAKEIFGLTSVLFISQKFHNERAIYIAKRKGIKAFGFNAKDVGGRSGTRVKVREYLARVKVFVDLIFNVQPKFLGEKIKIQ